MTRTRILAVLAGLGVAGLVAASAAQLNVTSDDLGAGVADVESCVADPNGVNVEYTSFVYNDTLGANGAAQIMSVRLEGLDADAFDNCLDQIASVTFVGPVDQTIYTATSDPIDGTDVTNNYVDIDVSAGDIDAADVVKTAVVITGPGA